MFEDRNDAGLRLAERLRRPWPVPPLVLALPRGGVSVAGPVAQALNCPLDVLVVRKLGAPGREELAIGAIVDGNPPLAVFNTSILRELNVGDEYLDAEMEAQTLEIKRRRMRYRVSSPLPDLRGRTIILVDDGVATGATMRAALKGVRAQGPREVIIAVPVAPPEVIESLRGEADEVVCLLAPANFGAVGEFYDEFQPVSDREVIEILKENDASRR